MVPAAARHTIAFPSAIAMATPSAPVSVRARSATSCNTSSRTKCSSCQTSASSASPLRSWVRRRRSCSCRLENASKACSASCPRAWLAELLPRGKCRRGKSRPGRKSPIRRRSHAGATRRRASLVQPDRAPPDRVPPDRARTNSARTDWGPAGSGSDCAGWCSFMQWKIPVDYSADTASRGNRLLNQFLRIHSAGTTIGGWPNWQLLSYSGLAPIAIFSLHARSGPLVRFECRLLHSAAIASYPF